MVADSHGSFRNLLVEQRHPEARLLRGRPRILAMVAAVASHLGAPLLLATGDDALVDEVRDLAPRAATVSVKRAVSASAAESLHPSVAGERIEAAARTATEQWAGVVVGRRSRRSCTGRRGPAVVAHPIRVR